MQRVTTLPANLLLATLMDCGSRPTTVPEPEPAAAGRVEAPAAAPSGPLADVYAAMDRSVSPCDDFYRYACGGWLAAHEIPEDRSSTSRVQGIDDASHEVLRELLEEAAQGAGDDARRDQIGESYAGCMEQAAIDAAGMTPLKPALAEIAKVRDAQSALETAMRLRPHGAEAFMSIKVYADALRPQTNLLGIRQGGLGLPSREDYLEDDTAAHERLTRYEQHIAGMLQLVRDRPADAAMRRPHGDGAAGGGRAVVRRAKIRGASKPTAEAMITAIEQAFERGLASLPWMDASTQARARTKARALRNLIGYPAVWRDSSQVKIDRQDYYGSVVAAHRAEHLRVALKADKPVDPQEWYMPASMVNAYTDPPGLELVFPAGILQLPMFSTDLPMAVNFGAIGSVMGHELTHNFDDQSRKYDETGAMVGWWSAEATAGFEAASRCVVARYDAYEVQPGLRVRGQQTLGENIADIGGLKYAHAGYVQWAKDHPEPAPPEGLTGEQLLFVAFAQNFCGKQTPQSERMRVLSDVHAPRRFRANGTVTSLPAFASAFACAEGSPMRPAKPCTVW